VPVSYFFVCCVWFQSRAQSRGSHVVFFPCVPLSAAFLLPQQVKMHKEAVEKFAGMYSHARSPTSVSTNGSSLRLCFPIETVWSCGVLRCSGRLSDLTATLVKLLEQLVARSVGGAAIQPPPQVCELPPLW
jgi:hypothetical protein